jgi:hypothetical protein
MILKKSKHYKKNSCGGKKKEKAWDCTRHKAKQGNPIVNEMSKYK